MATILDIATALKDAMSGIAGLHATATEPAHPVAPAAWPMLTEVDYSTTFEGDPRYVFDITVTVPMGTDFNRSVTFLMPFVDAEGSKSIPAVIDADPTLGGTVSSSAVLPSVRFGRLPIGDGEQLAATLRVECFA